MQIKVFIRQLLCMFLLLGLPMYALAEERDYIVVIDAGHGGKDPGAVGKKAKEKNINLKLECQKVSYQCFNLWKQ